MRHQVKAMLELVSRELAGATIIGAVHSKDGESWGLRVRRRGRLMTVWVDCDPEGNGPGHLAVQREEGND